MDSVFITGIAGFVGMHLALALKQRGYGVMGCDSFNSYYSPQLKKRRSEELEKAGIPLVHADVCTAGSLKELLKQSAATTLVHLAAQAGVRHSSTHPEEYLDNNLVGFFNALEACRYKPGISFIYASSSSVYGQNQKVPFAENDPTDSPSSFYGATKKANEVMAHSYHHLYGIPVTGLRFFTAYGPWGRPDMAYFFFLEHILSNKPITLFGEGNLSRDFTYIDDIVDGIIGAIELRSPCEIFNLGRGESASVSSLVDILESLAGKKAIRAYAPMPLGDVPATYCDLTKSRALLGYNPKVSLKEGLEKFSDWYFQYYGSSLSKIATEAKL